jgi:hypothetical protein
MGQGGDAIASIIEAADRKIPRRSVSDATLPPLIFVRSLLETVINFGR